MNQFQTCFKGLMAIALILLISCSGNQSGGLETSDVKVTYVTDLEPGTSARFLIAGMSCERMCVSAVKKGVTALPTVEVAEVNFDADVPVDTLVLDFDANLMDEAKIIEAIESQAGGDTYKVIEVQLSKASKTSLRIDPERVKHSSRELGVSEYRFEVPNLLDVIRKVSI